MSDINPYCDLNQHVQATVVKYAKYDRFWGNVLKMIVLQQVYYCHPRWLNDAEYDNDEIDSSDCQSGPVQHVQEDESEL